MNDPDVRQSPMALAMEWVGKILAVSLLMFVPGLVGQRLDRRWDSSWIGVVGFLLGTVLGFATLLAMTRKKD